MKNILLSATAACVTAITLFSSCTAALDIAPDGKTSLDEIFRDNFKTGAYLNSCYGRIPEYSHRFWHENRGPACVSDEAWDNDDTDYPYGVTIPMYNGNASAAFYPITEEVGFINVRNGKYYERFFEGIRHCATFLQRIDGANVTEERDRRRWKAEAHVLRAFYYMELLRWYGTGVPIVREPCAIDADFSGQEQPTYQQVASFIIEDCDAALATDELPWRITSTAERSRVTKALAAAIKSRVSLYAASPLYNVEEDQELWREAYRINSESLKALRDNGYALYKQVSNPTIYANDIDNPGNEAHLPNRTAALFQEYFTLDADYASTPRDRETIYSFWSRSRQIWTLEGIGCQAAYRAGTVPVQELVDAYETVDGQPVLVLDRPYLDEQHTRPNYNPDNTLYREDDPYANRDPRFYASIYYNGSKRTCLWKSTETPECLDNYVPGGNNGPTYRTRIISTWVGEPLTGIHETSRTRTRTGYYLRKFIAPNVGENTVPQEVGFNPVEKFFRLGEIILNCAEAAANVGELQEAWSLVNEIRRRASMPDLPAALIGDRDALMLRIRHERRIELAVEGHRYFDVRRWQKPDGDLAATDRWVTAMEITRHANPDNSLSHYTYRRRPVRAMERLCYTNKYLKAPIPLAESSKLHDITGRSWQNPGW